MAKVRASWTNGNQFSPSQNAEVDFEVNTFLIPVGSTLNRTWIDVRFNRHGEGTEPPEFINQCGPYMWGLCFYDDAANNPGVFAEDDDIDWLWREMITFGPAIQEPNAITSDPQWMQVSVGPTGLRDSKGQRKLNQAPAFLHWCFDLPNSFSSTAPGISWEVMVHTIWTVL
jgi:hypothetical protein